MRLLKVRSAVIALSLLDTCYGLTYWIDKTCSNRPNWNEFWKETISMATRSHARLGSTTDTDFAAVFERIFHTPTTDQQSLNTVRDIMNGQPNGIGQWTQQQDCRGQCNLRIYCDNDKRWVSRPSGGFLDSVNNMLFPGAWTQPGCREPSKKAFGETYTIKAPEPGPDKNGKPSPLAGQNSNRATMTICDKSFDEYPQSEKAPTALSDYPNNKDLTKLTISHFTFLISMTILHEWTHHPQFSRLDEPPNACYGWSCIIGLTRDQSLLNSDSYAYLGLWALLADRHTILGSGYTLPRLGNPPSQQAEDACREGKIAFYQQITQKVRRGVERIGKRFVG